MSTSGFSENKPQAFDKGVWVTENALLVRSDQKTPLAQAHEVFAWYEQIQNQKFSEVVELVPAANSLGVSFIEGSQPSAEVLSYLSHLVHSEPRELKVTATDIIEIPIRYGGAEGPDLALLSAEKGMSEDEVIKVHSSSLYTVAFTGFAPGFGYLIGLPDVLATPRRKEPRVEVPAGSLAIGGSFTGIYPQSAPGGWNLIGRTDFEIWDLTRDPPALLAPGSKIRFRPI